MQDRRKLVERAQAGDHGAFELLATTSIRQMRGTAYLVLGDRETAADAVQEALVRAWVGLPRLRDPARFDGWLRRLLLTACFDEGRRAARRPATVPVEGTGDVPVTDGVASLHDLAQRDAIEDALSGLPEPQRVVVVLRYYVGLEVDEIAEIVRARRATVRSRLRYAIRALRAALDADARLVDTPLETVTR